MKKIIFIEISLIIILLLGFKKTNICSQQTDNNNDIPIIIEGVKYGDMMIQSGKGSFVFENISPDSLSKINRLKKLIKENKVPFGILNTLWYDKKNIMYEFKGGKMKVKISDEEIYSFDGEKMNRLYLYSDSNGLIRPTGNICDTKEPIFGYYLPINCLPPLYPTFEKALSGFLNGNKIEFIDEVKEETIDNISCKVVSLSTTFESYTDTTTYWLAPSLYYRAIKIVDKHPGYTDICNISYKRYKDNIIFPKFIKKESYELNDSTDKYTVSNRREFTFNDDWEFNLSLPDSDF